MFSVRWYILFSYPFISTDDADAAIALPTQKAHGQQYVLLLLWSWRLPYQQNMEVCFFRVQFLRGISPRRVQVKCSAPASPPPTLSVFRSFIFYLALFSFFKILYSSSSELQPQLYCEITFLLLIKTSHSLFMEVVRSSGGSSSRPGRCCPAAGWRRTSGRRLVPPCSPLHGTPGPITCRIKFNDVSNPCSF